MDVTMPQLGETVTEGTITRWFKQPGDHVNADEALFEVSTDKVDSEVPASVAGVVSEIRVPEGETVAVGTVLAVIDAAVAPYAATPPVTAAPVATSPPPPELAPAPAAAPPKKIPAERQETAAIKSQDTTEQDSSAHEFNWTPNTKADRKSVV